MIGFLDDQHHERLWRICDALVSAAGARAAVLCDESSGRILLSVGDASASGSVSRVAALGPQEFALDGEAGQLYGVNIPGGALLLVLHDAGLGEQIRGAAAEAVHDLAEAIAELPPPPPEVTVHSHLVAETSTAKESRGPSPKPAPVARKKAATRIKAASRKKQKTRKQQKTAMRTKPARKQPAQAKKSARQQAPRKRAKPKRSSLPPRRPTPPRSTRI